MREKVAFFVAKFKSLPRILRDILYGMTVHEIDLELRKERGSLDHLFMLSVFGDLVGLLLLPPYYSLRLVPYIVPTICERFNKILNYRVPIRVDQRKVAKKTGFSITDTRLRSSL